MESSKKAKGFVKPSRSSARLAARFGAGDIIRDGKKGYLFFDKCICYHIGFAIDAKAFKAWDGIQREHTVAVSKTKDCLNAVVSRVPLVDGAKGKSQTVSQALRQAADIANSIKTTIYLLTTMAQRMASLLPELARVVTKEMALSEETLELLGVVADLEESVPALQQKNYIDLKVYITGCLNHQVDCEEVFSKDSSPLTKMNNNLTKLMLMTLDLVNYLSPS
ncbi:uncharacterized protein LOC110007001 [Amborella trichopoda]|uniref:uncharacterized protein LOC110007001 n=1 Tax=Amborella trichopoda TaxID=13333 RepID=UPI0009BF620B|nr:uncharacterized protein LOC110007001 [Amborella trichopoda]|eukprot:XP_020521174.1 uncharacterized protein LOC110007001 [Amborella trichopoda]